MNSTLVWVLVGYVICYIFTYTMYYQLHTLNSFTTTVKDLLIFGLKSLLAVAPLLLAVALITALIEWFFSLRFWSKVIVNRYKKD